MDIEFVHLGIQIEHLKNYISVFGFHIMFYGIIVGLGILAGITIAAKLSKIEGMGEDIIYDLALFEVPLCIIGARIYYVVFEWDYYSKHLSELINLRKGGLAIYGAVLMSMIVLAVFVKVRKVSPWQLADYGICGLILGQIIGRWGNFFNCEAFGGYTDSLFAMRINRALVNTSMIPDSLNAAMEANLPDIAADYIQVHPTFLYESCWNLCVLIFMLLYRKHRAFKGELLWIYFVGYGLGRFFIESLRTDQLKLWHTDLAVSQLLSAVLVLIGVIALAIGHGRARKGAEHAEEPAEQTSEATE
jgi:phosphatidylglycerol:prolipoprotein diacylglycerol transferase